MKKIIVGQAMLVYQEQNHCLPFDSNGNILFQKMPLQTISFKSYATPDIYNCKGVIQRDEKTNYIALGVSECFYDFFTNSRYVIDMKIKPDGSVVTYKKTVEKMISGFSKAMVYDTIVANCDIFIPSVPYCGNNYGQNEGSAEQECGVSIPCPERL